MYGENEIAYAAIDVGITCVREKSNLLGRGGDVMSFRAIRRAERWNRLLYDLESILLFVIRDTVSLLLLIGGLKIGEFVLDLVFTEQQPYVILFRDFTWFPFVGLYLYLVVSDLLIVVHDREMDHE